MDSKLNTSGVLTSGVDYFCLVCESRLHHEPGALAHIQKPVHTKKFEETDYFENKENCVRKINKWYFCELCSLLLPTAARVRLHVVEPQHLRNKSSRILERRGTSVVAYSRVKIDDKAWHGIIDDACVICNIELEDPNIHLNETNHILKLIQSKIDFDSNKNIFRKVDESSVQCITCNIIFGLNSIDSHFNEIEHKNLYQVCCDAYKTIMEKFALEKTESYKSNKDNDKSKSNEGNDLKNCDNSNDVDVDKNVILQSAEIDYKEIYKILEVKNYIIMDTDGKTRCLLCDWLLNCDVDSHINGLHHQTILALHIDHLKKPKANNNYNIIARDMKSEESIIKRPNFSDFVEKFQNNDININFEVQTAICKKCTKQLHFDVQAIEDHIATHLTNNERGSIEKPDENATGLENQGGNDSDYNKTSLCTKLVSNNNLEEQDMKKDKIDPKKNKVSYDMEKDIDNYIKQNEMTSYSDKKKVYCIKCNSNIPYSLRSLKEHVAGGGHQKRMNDKLKQSVEDNLNKIKTVTYIKFIFNTKGFNADIIINEKICINSYSFFLMVNVGDKLKCLLCNAYILKSQWKQHIALKMHEKDLDEILVVISKEHDKEFIRELRPNYFHCGHCNINRKSWKALESHLQSPAHRDNKTSSEWRLKQIAAQVFMENTLNGKEEIPHQMMSHMFQVNNNQCDSNGN